MRTCVAIGIQLIAATSLLSCKTAAVSPPSAGQSGTGADSEARAKPKLDPEIVEFVSRVSEERLSETLARIHASQERVWPRRAISWRGSCGRSAAWR